MARQSSISNPQSKIYTGELTGTPIGDLWLAVSELGLVAVEAGMSRAEFETYLVRRFGRPVAYDPGKVKAAAKELAEYLDGKRRRFTLVIDWTVLRPFQQAVLRATYAIPAARCAPTRRSPSRSAVRMRRAPSGGRRPPTRCRWCCPATGSSARTGSCTATDWGKG
jgi:hypothetical protein